MLVKKIKNPLISRSMTSIEIFDVGFIILAKLGVKGPDFFILIGHPFIRLYKVMPPPFYHKRPRENQISHFCITESIAHIEVGHFPLYTHSLPDWSFSIISLLIKVGTMTSKPFSAKCLAIWEPSANPGDKPANCSGS